MKNLDNKGFSLVELIIVIAIMATLTGIVGVNYSKYIMKAKRMADVNNAVTIRDALYAAVIDGRIVVDRTKSEPKGNGIWIIVAKDYNSLPGGYNAGKFKYTTCFCGTNNCIVVDGVASRNWDVWDENIARILKEVGIDPYTIRVNAYNDWDWYVVQVNFTKDGKFESYGIYSGYKGRDSSYEKHNTKDSLIENYL